MVARIETLPRRIRRLRAEAHRSCSDFAGVSEALLSLIENGKRNPSTKTLRLLAPQLGVSAHYLEFGYEDRAWTVLEIAKVWRERCRFLERRLDALEQQVTADPQSIDRELFAEVQRLREMAERMLEANDGS